MGAASRLYRKHRAYLDAILRRIRCIIQAEITIADVLTGAVTNDSKHGQDGIFPALERAFLLINSM